MGKPNNNAKFIVSLTLASLLTVEGVSGMGLRSFVALPVDLNGYVVRFSYEHLTAHNKDTFITSAAYGLTHEKTLLFAIPYINAADGKESFGDISALYRQTILQNDFYSGTSRLALLGGAIIPSDTNRDSAIQAGFVYTFFKDRYEFDLDAIYQAGIDNRPDSGRYDISMQYRLSPSLYPEWGIATELNAVTELNGRWKEGNEITHQITLGLQLVNPRWVIEGGIIKDINNDNNLSVMLSTRFHF